MVLLKIGAGFAAEHLAKGVHDALEERIRSKLKEVADKVVEEAAREIAQNLRSYLQEVTHLPGEEIVVSLHVDTKRVPLT